MTLSDSDSFVSRTATTLVNRPTEHMVTIPNLPSLIRSRCPKLHTHRVHFTGQFPTLRMTVAVMVHVIDVLETHLNGSPANIVTMTLIDNAVLSLTLQTLVMPTEKIDSVKRKKQKRLSKKKTKKKKKKVLLKRTTSSEFIRVVVAPDPARDS
jgi:hypothetical protein